MEDVVVDQRNADTARNFVLMLEKTNSNVGMIQFGAQHRDGLIQELQNQGVSVIAITPKSLVR